MRSANTLKVAALGLLITVSASCVYDPHYYGPPPPSRPAYYYPWGYYYYPSVRVYFQYATGFYFYFDNGVWIRSRVLPPRFRLDPRDRVHLEIRSDKPYLHQPQQYQPRPDYRPQPERDRTERESLRHWYQEQQQYKEEKRYAPPPRKDKEKEQRPR